LWEKNNLPSHNSIICDIALTNNPLAVFDSGVGSLSIIKELQRETPNEDLLYFADRFHFPYGHKSHTQLQEIILSSIKFLERYDPKVIILASMTPSIQILHKVMAQVNTPIIGVMPPLKRAARLSKKKHVGIMATEGTIVSHELSALIRKEIAQDVRVSRFNASPIIELIEKGIHMLDKRKTYDTISQILLKSLEDGDIDVVFLCSTHLPLIQNFLESLFPQVKFVDPSATVAREVRAYLRRNKSFRRSGRGRLKIIASGGNAQFEQTVRLMGIREPIKVVNP
jgi:glutamate racemase